MQIPRIQEINSETPVPQKEPTVPVKLPNQNPTPIPTQVLSDPAPAPTPRPSDDLHLDELFQQAKQRLLKPSSPEVPPEAHPIRQVATPTYHSSGFQISLPEEDPNNSSWWKNLIYIAPFALALMKK
jgi:hypothetical protein